MLFRSWPPMNLRSRLYAGGLFVAGLTVALGVAEAVLRFSGPSAQAQHMDAGLIEHHPRFGWQLAKNWQGTHEHDDYTAQYRTTPSGRARPAASPTAPVNWY